MSDRDSATRVLLVRHGESVDNVAGRISGWTDSVLTEVGREQARRMARHVSSHYRPSAVYSSTLRRATLTAAPLADMIGTTVVIRPNLRELHFGVAEGLSLEEVRERHAPVWERAQSEDDLSFGWPGGETRAEFYDRIRRELADIVSSHRGETVAVVSHGGVISSLLADLLVGNPAAWRRYLLHNCALTDLSASGEVITVREWNVTEHLHDER
ncbi:MAG TPA: histidine phosphatase family protein [Chloroflexota bacterium]|nr:histidine phosphatase family protein [Chloroflexota bacterium]